MTLAQLARPKRIKRHRASPHPHIERYAAICALLMKAKRTPRELNEVLGIHPRSGNGTLVLLDALRDEGLIYVADYRRSGRFWVPEYAWQPSVCEMPDAMHPKRQEIASPATSSAPLPCGAPT